MTQNRKPARPTCIAMPIQQTPPMHPPPVILGCGTFGGLGGARHLIGHGLDRIAAWRTLDEAAALGLTMWDTAERYAHGESESGIRTSSPAAALLSSPLRRPYSRTSPWAVCTVAMGRSALGLRFYHPCVAGRPVCR